MSAQLKFAAAIKNEVPMRDFIPYSSHVTENIIKTTNGDYVFCIRVLGAAHQSADTVDINSWHNQLNGFMRNLSSPNVAVWSNIIRREFNEYPGGAYPAGFIHDLNEKYRAQMGADTLMINELYVSVVYRPQPMKAGRIFDMFAPIGMRERIEEQQDHIDQVDDLIKTTLVALDRYEPQLLGCYELNGHMFSEACEFLAYLINGEWHRIPLPRAELRDVVTTVRPFFTKAGLMSLLSPTKTTYAAALAIQEYPAHTAPGMLDDLLSVPYEFMLGQSFTFMSKPVAKGRMTRQQARLVNAGDVAKSQVEALDDALDDITSNRFVLGTHSISIIIRADNDKHLKENISMAGTVLADQGIKWTREDIGCAGAYWSLLPGNFPFRIRQGDINSRNFAGFSSLHNYPIGRITGNQWGDAVTMFKTTSGAPFYFSFHKGEEGVDAKRAAKLDPNHKELANTIVIGKSGTGKTVLESFLLAQLQKFNKPPHRRLTSVVFDKDLGAAVAVRGMGGRYYPLKNGRSTGLNPFQCEPTPNNLTFLETLVAYLCRHGDTPLTARERAEISAAIAGVMSPRVAKEKRRLRGVLEFLDRSKENGLAERLQRWTRPGPLGWLLDNPEDTLDLDSTPIVGFDMTEFLDNDETRTPLTMYLMHRIESLFDGRRVVIFMDEFWRLLDDPEFTDFIKNKLVTIRKQDGFLVMLTQAPQQVMQSKIAFAIIGQTATKIFLPNPEADRADYIDGFKVSEQEFELIKGLGEKSRKFLVKQGANSAVAELNLRGFDDELAVMSGNTATSLLAERLVAEFGDNPDIWLPEFHAARRKILE